MDDERTTAKPAFFWGTIQAGAREHESTAQIWDRIRTAATENNLALPADMFSEVNRMRALASGLAYAGESLAKLSDGDVITSNQIGQQLYQRSSADLREIAALYHVRFEMTTISALGPTTSWYTFDASDTLPATKGELIDDLSAYGQSLTDGYGVEFGGIGAVEIGAW